MQILRWQDTKAGYLLDYVGRKLGRVVIDDGKHLPKSRYKGVNDESIKGKSEVIYETYTHTKDKNQQQDKTDEDT